MEDLNALDAGRVVHFKWAYRALGTQELDALAARRDTLEHEAVAALEAVLAERGALPADHLARRYTGFGGFVARHYNGDYSLARSYWLHLVVPSTAATLVLTSVLPLLAPALSATRVSLLAVATIALHAASWIWGIIGTWRSASKHGARTGKGFWAGATKVAIAFGLLANIAEMRTAAPVLWEHTRVAFGAQPGEPVQLQVRADGKSLLLSGGINDHTAEALDIALQHAPGVTTVVLESGGGWIRQGQKIGEVIARRNLNTYVETECTSACTIAFLAGKDRAMAPEARLGFHAFRAIGGVPLRDRESDIYGAAGIGDAFIRRVAATPHASVWYPDHGRLLAERVLTRYSEGGETSALSSTMKDLQQLRQAFLQHDTYTLLHERHPQRLESIVQAAWRAVQDKRTDREVLAAASAALGVHYRELLPLADDDTVVSLIDLMADQGQALQPTAPALCVRVVFESGMDAAATRRVLPASLQKREQQLVQAVLRTSAPGNVVQPTRAQVRAAIGSLTTRMKREDVRAISAGDDGTASASARCAAGLN
ncbi:MAG: hypothetical protein EOO24_30835, partial [Comamonadaceae bacterium]